MNRSAARRSGLTLVEVLIVIAIIGLLIQLILPAVESAREAARMAHCKNNLRQLGLAVQSHEAAQGYLPTAGWGWGWMADPDRGVGKHQPGSWCYQLLPYLEGGTHHSVGRGTEATAKYEALSQLAASPFSLLHCPSRRLARALPNTHGPAPNLEGDGDLFWYNARRAEKLAKSDYVANLGDKWFFWREGPPPSKAKAGNGFLAFYDLQGKPLSVYLASGVVMQREPIRLRQIEDGTSSTYFAGEKPLFMPDYKTGVPMNDDQSCWNGDDMDLMASTEFAPRRDPPEFDWNMGMPFGSAHIDAMNMVYCDGSVHSVSYDIDPQVHNAAGSRFDGSTQ